VKAAVFDALNVPLNIENVPDPTPGPTEVIVKVGRCGICGSDLHATQDPVFGVQHGAVLGHEYAGEVVARGSQVEGLREGDRVAVMPTHGCGHCASCLVGEFAWCRNHKLKGGGYAQLSVAEPHQCIRLPDTVSLEDGALVEPLAVSLRGVNLSPIRSGSRVLVMGEGPIGLGAIFWAKRLGATKVATTGLTREREDLARTMGSDFFFQASDNDLNAEIDRALGGPPDIVFECVGARGLISQAIDHVKIHGTVVVVGMCTTPDTFSPWAMIQKQAVIQPSAFYGLREFEIAIDTLDAGHVEPHAMISETVSLGDMPPAFEALKERTTQCKVMVDPWAA